MKLKLYLILIIAIAFSLNAKANSIPTFINGGRQNVVICQNTSSTIDSLIVTNDSDVGQTLTWAVYKSALNGTLHGFPANATSNGGIVPPGGFSYTPYNGFSGIDSFIISVNDGFATSYTTIVFTIISSTVSTPIQGASSVCAGTTTTLTDASPGGTWTSNRLTVATVNSATGVVRGVAVGSATITYTLTGNGGCTVSASKVITVSAFPAVSAIVGTKTNVCVGDTLLVTDTTAGGVWAISNSNAILNSKGVVTAINNTIGGGRDTISYTVTNAAGCSTPVIYAIRVRALPVVTPITGTTSFCNGKNSQLTGTNSGAGVTATWTSSNTNVAVVNATGLVVSVNVGTAIITNKVTNGNGCSDSVTTVVTVSGPPVIDTISATSFSVCSGFTTKLSDDSTGGTWSSGNTALATVNSTGLVTGGTTPGIVAIIYTLNKNGCSNTVSTNITVNGTPTVAPIGGSNTTCLGSNITLTDATPNGVWSSSNNKIASVNSSGIVSALSLGADSIYYTITNVNTGCSKTDTLPITIVSGLTVSPITGTTAICTGKTSALKDLSTGGVWTTSDSTVAIVGKTSGIVIAQSGGTATITYTVTNGTSGCSGNSSTIVTVTQTPVITPILGTTNLCLGTTSQLSDSTVGGFWTSSNNSIGTVSANGLVTGLTAGNILISYTVIGTGGCNSVKSVNFAVNDTPTVAKMVGTNATCVTAQPQFSDVTLNGVWASSNGNVAYIDQNGLVTPLTNGSTTISYTVTSGNGCSKSSSINLNIYNTLVVSPIHGSNSICENATETLTDSTSGGVWASSNTTIANINASTGLLSPITTLTKTSTVTISYNFTDPNSGCSGSASMLVTVNIKPTVSAIGGGPNGPVFCPGSSAVYTDNTTNGVWSSGNSNIITIDSLGTALAIAAGTTSVNYTVTNAAGCSNFATINQTVTNFGGGGGAITISGIRNECVGNKQTLTTNRTGGYWESSNTAIATVDSAGGIVTGISAGVARLIYTIPGGGFCPRTQNTYDTVYALPVVSTITGSNAVCVGKSNVLVDVTANGTWSSSNTSIALVTNSGIVTGLVKGVDTISYKITDPVTLCTNSATSVLAVNPLPVIPAIVGANGVCIGKTNLLTDTAKNGVWFSTNNKIAAINNGTVTGNAVGLDTIRYIVTNIFGCTDSVSKTQTVNALPVINSITGTTSVCVNQNTTLSNTTTGGTWVSANTNIATVNSTTGVVSGISAGNVVIRYLVTNVNGCTDSVSTTVTVNPLPKIGTILGINYVCVNQSISFKDTTAGGTWTNSNQSVGLLNGATLNAISAGSTTIRYIVTNNNGCTDSVSMNVTVNALPVISAITGINGVCVGNTTALSSSPTGGTWVSVSPAIATINSSGVVKGVAAGGTTIRYIVTNVNGCTDSVSTAVSVYGLPVISPITGVTPICVGKSVIVSDQTTGGIWSIANSSVASTSTDIQSNQLVNGLKAGSTFVRYTVTDLNGCTDSVSAAVTVNALPVIAPIAGNSSVCVGKIILISESTLGGSLFNSNPLIASMKNVGLDSANVTGLTSGTTRFTYIVTNINGCTDSVSKSVTVNPLPVITSITGITTICKGKTTTLASTPTGGAWKSVSTNVATILNTGVATGVAAGSSTIRYTVTTVNGCVDSVSTSITVNALPVIAPIAGNTTICAGKTTILSETTIGGSLINYSPSVASSVTNGLDSAFITGLKAGTDKFTYTVTNSNGCTDSVSATVTVNPLPVLTPITGNTAICAGKTGQLNESASIGSWESINTGVATIGSTGNVTAVSAGTSIIRFISTTLSGCTDSVSTTVTVNALPTFTAITGASSVCAGKTTQLSESTTGGTWKSVSSSVATVDANGLVTGVKAGTSVIRYSLTNSNSCTDSVATSVTVNALPTFTAISGTTTLCAGKTSQLSESTTGGFWKSVNPAVASIDINGLVTANAAGTSVIRYIATNSNSCTDSVSVTITVNALPVLSPITGNTAVCLGKTTTLAGTPTGGVWKSLSTNIATINSAGIVSGVAAGSSVIRYTVTNSNSCTDSIATNVTVNPLPVIASISGNTPVCAGKTVQLNETTTGGNWKSANISIATIDVNGQVTAVKAGSDSIRYTFTDVNGCTDSVAVVVTVNALPVIGAITGKTSICAGQTTLLSSTTTGGLWFSTNTAVATIDNSGNITGVADGITTIRYIVTNSNGCTDSISISDTVHALPVISPITGSSSVCSGSSVTLSSSTQGGTWVSVTPFTATVNSSTGVVTGGRFPGGTTIRYIVGNIYGCSDSVFKVITVNPTPSLGPITGVTNTCIGSQLIAADFVEGGKWSLSDTINATIDSLSGTITAKNAGVDTAYYTYTNFSGCSAVVDTVFNVYTIPSIISIGSNTPVNQPDTIFLNASSSVAGVVYNWTGPNNYVSNVQNPFVSNSSLLTAGKYYVTANNNGCISQPDSTQVFVNVSYYVTGSVLTPLQKVIPNITMYVTGSSVKSTNPDANGNYSFLLGSGANNSFIITPKKANEKNKKNGVSAIDISLVQSHILQKSILNSPYKILAADVNNDGKISALDIVYMKRLILSLDTVFPGGRLWEFVDSNFVLAKVPASPFKFKQVDTVGNLNANSTGNSFIGLKLGDVNWDWSPGIARGTVLGNTYNPIELYYHNTTPDENGLVKIPVTAKNFKSILGMQFTLNYNKNVFDFVAINNGSLNVDFANPANDGSLTILWNDPTATQQTLNDGSVLFELVLQKKNSFVSEDISIDSRVTDVEAFDGNYIQHGIIKTSGTIVNKESIIATATPETYVHIGPNPNKGKFIIEILSNEHKTVSLQMVNMEGKTIWSQKKELQIGVNSINVNLAQTAVISGNYFLKIDDGKSVNSKLVLIN